MDKNQLWEQNAQNNADTISKEISSLKSGHWSHFLERDYKSFFNHAKEISNLFKNLKPLRKSDRERLWNEYRYICDEVSRKRKEEWERRERKSKQEKDICLSFIRDAHYAAKGARDRNDIKSAREQFNKTYSELRDRSKNMRKEDSGECWQAYKEAKNTLHFRIKDLQDYDYSEAKSAISDALSALQYKDNPFEALKEIKEARSRTKGLYLNKEQAEHVRHEFDRIWNSLSHKIEEYKKEKQRKHEEWLRRKEEKERKHQEWLSRQQENIQRWENRVDKLQDVVRRIENQIDDLEYKRSSARSDDFARRCSDWISEKHNKISDIESTIRELQSKISDVRNKIGY